jgi:hypothetical protein
MVAAAAITGAVVDARDVFAIGDTERKASNAS